MNKLFSHIFAYGFVNALKSLVPFLMLPILTTYLGVEEFGKLSLIETTILFITPFILLGIHGAINVEYFRLSSSELKKYITNALLLSFLSFLFFISLAFIFKDSMSTLLGIESHFVVWLIVFSFLRVVSSVVLGLYQMKQQVGKFTLYTLSQTFIDLGLSYLFVVLYMHGYLGRLWGIYISFTLASIIGFMILYKMNYIGKITFIYTKDILKFGLPLIPHAIGGTIIAMSDRYFISYSEGNEQVGLYVVAYQISALMLLVGMSINQAWSPMFLRMMKNKQIDLIGRYTLVLMGGLLSVGFILYLLEDIFFYLLVDNSFYKAKDFFMFLLIGFIFQSLYFLVTNLLFYEKKTGLLAKITIVGATLNIVLNYFFIKIYGTVGVAYATAITWMIFFMMVLVINRILLRKHYTRLS